MTSLRVIVHGDVQGVGYRWFTRRAAADAGVSGWVRNRRDGTVEADLHGTDAAVQSVLASMAQGPAGARVDEVTRLDTAETAAIGFEILGNA
ncbi:MAG: acylphosphatase [Microbacterium sp.]|uniref:acylphosphatase n=1 Tax=Microbacterium sp. TaxID=51671 RepID=UPI003F959673